VLLQQLMPIAATAAITARLSQRRRVLRDVMMSVREGVSGRQKR
jgi:hypothetical protein